jgi:hypothetical protein
VKLPYPIRADVDRDWIYMDPAPYGGSTCTYYFKAGRGQRKAIQGNFLICNTWGERLGLDALRSYEVQLTRTRPKGKGLHTVRVKWTGRTQVQLPSLGKDGRDVTVMLALFEVVQEALGGSCDSAPPFECWATFHPVPK